MEVKKLLANHTCNRIHKCGNFETSSSWIARNIKIYVQANPNIKPTEIMGLIHQRYQLEINYDNAWRGREKASEMIFGNVEQSYDLVLALVAELNY